MLPAIVEYLLTLERPGGGRLVLQGNQQTTVLAFPALTTVTLAAVPTTEYMFISYKVGFDPGMVPGAFFAIGQAYGARPYDSPIYQYLTGTDVDVWIPITKNRPTYARITNLTNMPQFYSGRNWYIIINTEDDYKLVQDALRRLYTSTKSEALMAELTRILGLMATAQGVKI
ncbi:MAG: hypothetical protein Q7R34_05490 [Dehalococcoidia bacterium]|nr:hypothetical protein [Dehalococcoidia bacterium]